MDLEATVRALAPKVLGYCIMRTGDPSLAEEIAQDSLAALVHRCRRHGSPRSPDGFVFAVARRRAARAMFKRRLLLPLEYLGSRHDGRPDPEQGLAQDEDRRRLVSALARLGRRDRELMLLLCVAELSTREAAQLLGLSVSAVKMRTLRARGRLRALLEDGNGTRG